MNVQNDSRNVMTQPLISTIIPTYNRANLVCDAIDSVLGQTYPHVEVVVVDDGSTDNTIEVLARYGDKIRVIQQANAGPSAARNRGIQASNGEIIAFLDSDDLWLPAKLQRQAAILMRVDKSVPCCLCNAIMRYDDGEQRFFDMALLKPRYDEGLWLNVAQVLSSRFVFFNQAVAIRREALDKAGLFDESLLFMEDHDMALRMAFIGPWTYIKEPLVVWRSGSENSLCEQAKKDAISYQCCMEKIYANILMRQTIQCHSVRRRLRHRLAVAHREVQAQRLLKKSVFMSHSMAKALKYFNRFTDAALRRSPWYPRMEVAQIN
jgi:glycosyltransferase involved in cell wall biosynthesis